MKLLFLTIFIGLSFNTSFAQQVLEGKQQITVEFPNLVMVISDINPSEFKVIISGNSAIIKPLVYKRIDGKKILINGKDIKELSVRIHFEFGILQYLTDDRPRDQYNFGFAFIFVIMNFKL